MKLMFLVFLLCMQFSCATDQEDWEIYNKEAAQLLKAGEYRGAEGIAERAMQVARSKLSGEAKKEAEFRSSLQLGYICYHSHKYDKAIRYLSFTQTNQLFQTHDVRVKIGVYMMLGEANVFNDNLIEGITNYEQALALIESDKKLFRGLHKTVLNNLGMYLYEAGRGNDALIHYKAHLEILKEENALATNDSYKLLGNIASLYLGSKQPDNAQLFLDLILEFSERPGAEPIDLLYKMDVKFKIATCYRNRKEYSEALSVVTDCLKEISRSNSVNRDILLLEADVMRAAILIKIDGADEQAIELCWEIASNPDFKNLSKDSQELVFNLMNELGEDRPSP